MTKDQPASKKDARAKREARLAARLRENLKRRKAQARARTHTGVSGEAPDGDGSETGQT